MTSRHLKARLGAALLTAAVALPAARAQAPADVRHATARLPSGVTVHYAESGDPRGVPVLFLHGYSDSWRSFAGVMARLPAGVRAIAIDQRGHGDSERPECCYTRADFAADAVATLDALGIRRAAVVGHSMGSFVAQRVAIDHPDRVTALVLVGSGRHTGIAPLVEFVNELRTLRDPIPTALIRDFQVGTVHTPLPAAELDSVVQESAKMPARVWRDALEHFVAADNAADLRHVAARTLVVVGAEDRYWPPAEAHALRKAIPGAAIAVYENTGHAVHWEQPERFTRDLVSFLRGGRVASR